MKVNGTLLPSNAKQWKLVPGESSVETATVMGGLLPASIGRGFGTRTATLSIIVRAMNDRDTIETTISRVLAMFQGTVTVTLDHNEFAPYFYGSVKSYSVKPLIKKREQILILNLQGIFYDEESYSNAESDGTGTIWSYNIDFPSSSDYRPCSLALMGGTVESDVKGVFFDPNTGEPLVAHVDARARVFINGLTGMTGVPMEIEQSGDWAPVDFLEYSYGPIARYGRFPAYPLVKPGTSRVVVEETYADNGGTMVLKIFNVRR